jgi:tripartite-type tricarboxylate transporter receptor subunit TctC
MKPRILSLIKVLFGVFILSSTSLQAQDSFYKGQTIRLIVGTIPGGGFDLYSRTIARHWGKHIPGSPDFAVENMAGEAFLVATNYLYAKAKPDGLTIGNWIGTMILHQLMGRKGILFDARKFEYIGAPTKVHDVCWMSKASGISSIEQWLASPVPLKWGVTPPGSAPRDYAAVLKAALGVPAQFVSGYKGIEGIRRAVEIGEVAGLCGLSWEAGKATWQDRIQSGDIKVILQNSSVPHPELPGVPLAISYAKTDLARDLIQTAIHKSSEITYLYSLPPNTPEDRVGVLRKSFTQTMKDPEFMADAKKLRLDINPLTNEQIKEIVTHHFKMDESLVNALKEILR